MNLRAPVMLALLLAAAWLSLDQWSKLWAETNLVEGVSVPLIGDWFTLRLTHNPGAAFGLGTGYIWVLTVIAGLAVLVLGFFALRVNNRGWAIAIGSMLGGATSHFLDRMFGGETLANGKIIDFLNYGGLFIGNIADIALVGAAAFGVLLSLFGVPFAQSERQEREK